MHNNSMIFSISLIIFDMIDYHFDICQGGHNNHLSTAKFWNIFRCKINFEIFKLFHRDIIRLFFGNNFLIDTLFQLHFDFLLHRHRSID